MNFEEIQKFAMDIDVNTISPAKKVLVKCYRDMIVEQTNEIFKMEKRINHFKEKITEHLLGLEKLDIVFKVKEQDDEPLPKGNEKSTQGKEVLREPGLPSGDSKIQQVVKE